MKVVVIGANGQLGCDVCKEFSASGYELFQLNHDVIDIADLNSVKTQCEQIKPHIVVNTAAMHNVEACENNPLKAFKINGLGARNLALLANDLNFTLFHISTDYVFDGKKKIPYIESDCPFPLNIYGNTKYSGEIFIETIAEKYFVIRVSGLFGNNPCRAKGGDNFVRLMLKLSKERDEIRVIDDEVLSPTFTQDVAKQLVTMSKTNQYGLYHVTAQGECSWYKFASKIFELCGINANLSIADPSEFDTKVLRPKYSALENEKLQQLGIDLMPHWEEGLRKYLKQIKALN